MSVVCKFLALPFVLATLLFAGLTVLCSLPAKWLLGEDMRVLPD